MNIKRYYYIPIIKCSVCEGMNYSNEMFMGINGKIYCTNCYIK